MLNFAEQEERIWATNRKIVQSRSDEEQAVLSALSHEEAQVQRLRSGLKTLIYPLILDKIDARYRGAFPQDFPDASLPSVLSDSVVVYSARPGTVLTMTPILQKTYTLGGKTRDRVSYQFVLVADGQVVPFSPQKVTHRVDKKFCRRSENLDFEVVCSGCGRHIQKWKKCGRCKKTRYCGRACHRKHWQNGHREECVAPES